MVKNCIQRSLFRQMLLTNQRLLFLKNEEIDSEISLTNIKEATFKRYARFGTPYLRLTLQDGNTTHLVFESLIQRTLGAFVPRARAEDTEAERIVKEWEKEINLMTREAVIRQRQESLPLPPPPPPPTLAPTYPMCGQPLTFIQQYNRWYCYNCHKYQ